MHTLHTHHPYPPPTPQVLPLRPGIRGLHPAEQTHPRGALQGHPGAAGGSCHRRRPVPHVSAAGSMRCVAQQGDVCCHRALVGDEGGGGGRSLDVGQRSTIARRSTRAPRLLGSFSAGPCLGGFGGGYGSSDDDGHLMWLQAGVPKSSLFLLQGNAGRLWRRLRQLGRR